MMQLCIKTKGPDLVITNCLAPHTWASRDISKEDAYELIEMHRDQGRNDLTLEEYYPDAERLGRNPDLH